MELPNLFHSPPPDRYFLALVVVENQMQAALWKIQDGSIEVVKVSTPQDYGDEAESVVAADQSLQELGELSEGVNEVVFGFPAAWVGATGLRDDRKPLLKNLTKELSLKPSGFVVITEAMTQYLRRLPDTSTSLVVSILPTAVNLHWLQRGEVKAEAEVGRSGQLAADVVEALARFPVAKDDASHVWPPRIEVVAFGISDEELHKSEQQLQGYDWVGQQGFRHQPTVHQSPGDTAAIAVVKEGGRAVAEAQGLLHTHQPDKLETASFSEPGRSAAPPLAGVVSDLPLDAIANVVTPSELGFEPVVTEPERAVMTDTMPLPPKSNDVGFDSPALEVGEEPLQFKSSVGPKPYKLVIGVGVSLGLLTLILVALGALAWNSTAEVQLKLKSKTLAQELTLKLDPKATTSDPVDRILAARVVSQTVSGEKGVPTTGVKLVGDKAKGTVIVINKTDATKTLSAGTKLSQDKIVFTLDKDVTVASASVSQQGSLSETRTYGKAEATVTAEAIGTESNLGKDTALAVADFAENTYSAVVKDGLTGGASREIRVVSEKDRANLLEKLKAELQVQVNEKLKEQTQAQEYTVPSGSLTIDKQEFDAKVGEEVEGLSLKLTVTGEGLTYRTDDLLPLATAVLSEQVPDGYQLSSAPPQLLTSPDNSASSAANVQLSANLSTVAYPKVDVEQWRSEIKSLSVAKAEAKLKSHAEVESVTVSLWPKWLGKVWRRLPLRTQAIKMQVQP